MTNIAKLTIAITPKKDSILPKTELLLVIDRSKELVLRTGSS